MPLPEGIIGNRYWNANGQGVAIAACWEEGAGGQPDPVSEIDAVLWAKRFGCKLSDSEALALMAEVYHAMYTRGITYRS